MARKFGVEIEVIGGNISMSRCAEIMREGGVEVNVESYGHTRRAFWKIVTDGSLTGRNGYEIVSPPLDGDAGIREVRKVAGILRNAGVTVNRSCGFHVHVDARDLTAEHFKNVAKLVVIHEAHFKRVLPEARHSNTYAQFPSAMFPSTSVDDICAMIDACADVRALLRLWGHNRYRAINFEAIARHGTVEFRAHSGTVDENKMAAWASLCVGLVRRAMVSEIVKPRWENGRKRNWQDFIRGAGKEHMAYFLKRWEELGGVTVKVYKSREARAQQLAKKEHNDDQT